MANTFELISSVTVGSGGAASIDFTSIPSTYTDLCFKLSLRTNNGSVYDWLFMNINNGGAGASISGKLIWGDGASPTSGSYGYTGLINGNSATSSTFSNTEIYLPNYLSSSYKSISTDTVTENNGTTAYANLTANLWSQTAAINSVKFSMGTGSSFNQYSTAYLYGVKNA